MKKLAKYFIIYFGVILINNIGFAQTKVSGIISSDTTWAVAGSPYIVTGGVLVDSGVTLTIDPGVIVKFNPKNTLGIDGTLIARGTETEKITFTTNSGGDYWGYIHFRDFSTDAEYDEFGNFISGSILQYCIVEYAGDMSVSYNGAIWIDNAYPFINYCTIQNNSSNGIYALNNIRIPDKTLKIMNSAIHNNNTGGYGGTAGAGGGILIIGGRANISNNNISYNTASNGGGIYVNSGTLITILNNNISNNTALGRGGGIGNDNGTIIISNNIIINNTAFSSGGGINVVSENVTISNNIISSNTVSDGNGGGIAANFFWVEVTISNNTIVNNSATNIPAVSYDARYDRDFKYNTMTGNQATGPNPTCAVYVKQHPFFNNNNIFNNTATYELWNDNGNQITDVDATNNWWGTISDSKIQSKIYDWFDNGSLGIIDYDPYLSNPDTAAPISPPMNVIKSMVNGNVQLTWEANPELDVAGYKIYYGSPTGYSFENIVDVGNVTNYTVFGVSDIDTIAVTACDNFANGVNDQIEGHESWFTIATLKNMTLVDDKLIGVPSKFGLSQNYPNPFNPTTTIQYEVPEQTYISLLIYDILGREVKTLLNRTSQPGIFEMSWDGTDNFQNQVAGGVYFCRMEAEDPSTRSGHRFVKTIKLALVR